MTLARLPAGRRFALREMPEVRGTLIALGEGSALVELDGEPSFRTFESGGRTICIESSGRKRTTITRSVEVTPL